MAEYVFEVTEPFHCAHFYTVVAGTRAEALEKVLDGGEGVRVVKGDIYPDRPLNVRDVRRIGRVRRFTRKSGWEHDMSRVLFMGTTSGWRRKPVDWYIAGGVLNVRVLRWHFAKVLPDPTDRLDEEAR